MSEKEKELSEFDKLLLNEKDSLENRHLIEDNEILNGNKFY